MFRSGTFSLSELLTVSGINGSVIVDSDLRKHAFCTPCENDCLWLICNKERDKEVHYASSIAALRLGCGMWNNINNCWCKGRVDADQSTEQCRSQWWCEGGGYCSVWVLHVSKLWLLLYGMLFSLSFFSSLCIYSFLDQECLLFSLISCTID